MNKKVCRYFAGFMHSQARWLNKMATEGYRLVRTDLTHYEFEPCAPDEYEYAVEYTGIGIIDAEAQDLNVYSVSASSLMASSASA